MSVADRKEREKQQRRKDIVDAAEKRFIASGFDGVSMDEIARDLELSKPTLYLYFKNKESLFLAVVTRGLILLRDQIKAAVERETTGIEKVKAFTQAFLVYARQYPAYYELTMAARSRRFMGAISSGEVEVPLDYGQTALDVITLLIGAIGLGQQDGTVRQGLDPVGTAIFLSMVCEGAVRLGPEWEVLMQMNQLSTDRYYELALSILLHGIAAEGGSK